MASIEAVSFRRFMREVGRYGPSALLPEVARLASQQALRHREGADGYFDGKTGVTPWALVEVARECIVNGIESGRPATADDVRRLCNLYANLEDPLTESPQASIDQFLVRLGFEQFRWQISEFEEISRSRALLVEAARQVHTAIAFTDDAWEAAIGCSVDEFIRVGFFLYVWAARHDGWIDLSYLDLPHFESVLELFPRDRVLSIIGRLLAATPGELRALESSGVVQDNVMEHRFNPLHARPLVRMRGGRLLAPHPLLLLQRLGVNGLYYDRVKDNGFTDQLGPVFEAYVGMNLDLIAGATIHREVTLGSKGKSVDFVVVLPKVTLLVEAKATRLTEPARAGLKELDGDRERTLGKAQSQIDRTHELATAGHPALEFIPTDRPFRGLIVTLEPFWMAMSGFGPPSSGVVRTTTASIREVEQFCVSSSTNDVSDVLLKLPVQHSNQVLAKAVSGDRDKNPILDRNWKAALRRIS